MKKLALLLLGLILGFLLSYFFFPQEGGVEGVDPPPVPRDKIIKPDAMIVLDSTYNARYRVVSEFIGRDDNRSNWFALDDLRGYLNFAEKQAKELGYTMNGVRLYSGAYEANGQGQPGYSTVFFAPTGTLNKSKGSVLNFVYDDNDDIPGGHGYNFGEVGDPPNSNYGDDE